MKKSGNLHKKIFILTIGIILLILIIIITTIKKTPVVKVDVALVKKSDFISTLYARGRIIPQESVEIRTPISGKIILKTKKAGEKVKKGEILLKLDKTPFEANLEEVKFNLFKNRKLLHSLKNPPYELKKVKNELLKANLDLEYLIKKRDSYEKLSGKEAISLSELDSLIKQIEDAKLQIKQFEIDVENYEKIWRDNLALINERLTLDEKAFKKAENDLKDTEIISPINGVIMEDLVGLKEYILVGESLFKIMNMDKPLVNAKIEEWDINRVKIGQKAVITGEWLPDKNHPLKGEIIKISPCATTGEYPYIEAIIELRSIPEHLTLLPNSSVDIEITIEKLKDVIVIPLNALINKEGSYFVYTVENSYARMKKVVIGVSNETKVVIKKGLQEGEKIIISNMGRIPPGVRVKEMNL